MTSSSTIQQWLMLDTQIEKLTEQLNILKKQKASIEPSIIENSNQQPIIIDKYKITVGKENHYTYVSFSFLEENLSKIIKDQNKVKEIIQYIKNSRQKKSHLILKRSLLK